MNAQNLDRICKKHGLKPADVLSSLSIPADNNSDRRAVDTFVRTLNTGLAKQGLQVITVHTASEPTFDALVCKTPSPP